MTMHTVELTEPAQIEKIKQELRNDERFFKVNAVAIGDHPEFGHVILIEGDGRTLMIADSVRFLE